MKLYAGLLTLALMSAPHAGFADAIVRQATAKISVIKTTMTKVNGRYQKTDTKVCSVQVSVPVRDTRAPGSLPPKYWGESQCESTVQNKPVIIATNILTMLTTANSPWDEGKVLELKGMSAWSYVHAKNNDIPRDSMQGNLRANSFTEDLNLKTMAFELMPDIDWSSGACSVEPGKPSVPCPIDETVSFEEYFSVYVLIEDKN